MTFSATPLTADYDGRVIWLLRHGEAEDGDGDDAARALTDKGKRQSEWAGRALAELGVHVDACLTSPKVRALETARIACEQLDLSVEPELEESLSGGGLELAAVTAGRGDVLLVGHEPDFSNAIGDATGGRVKLKKGGLAALEDGVLHVLARPAELKRIAG
jgi:phosphohistidine phosphatase